MKRRNRWLCAALAGILLLSCPMTVLAGREESEQDKDVTLAPYFFIEGTDPSTDPFPLKGTEVTANVNGAIAEIRLIQRYANEGENPINAKYVFPTSTRAAVHGMTMTVGSHMVRAQIKEKKKPNKCMRKPRAKAKMPLFWKSSAPTSFLWMWPILCQETRSP